MLSALKVRLGTPSIALAVGCLYMAATTGPYAPIWMFFGIGFALLGIGLLDMATDPRRKPNPRTAFGVEVCGDDRLPEGVAVAVDPTQTPEAKVWLEELRRG